MTYLAFIGGLSVGLIIGFAICSMLAVNKIQSAYSDGYDRGKIVSRNSIN